METVKVDIQKLQVLNDRINQTIDALGQLRQSVHAYQPVGIQHTSQAFLPQQQFGFGYGMPAAYGQQLGLQHTPFVVPQQTMGYNVQNWPYAVAPQMGWIGPMGGLSHTSVTPIDPSVRRLTQTFPFVLSPVPMIAL